MAVNPSSIPELSNESYIAAGLLVDAVEMMRLTEKLQGQLTAMGGSMTIGQIVISLLPQQPEPSPEPESTSVE